MASLAPFVAPDIVWDFRLPRVKSISASGHKFGLAPLGCGWVIWRDEEALPQELVFNVDYRVVKLVLSPSTSPARRVR